MSSFELHIELYTVLAGRQQTSPHRTIATKPIAKRTDNSSSFLSLQPCTALCSLSHGAYTPRMRIEYVRVQLLLGEVQRVI